jgi:hypothetical protein
MLSQPDGHRWGAHPAPLSQALVRHHKVVEADYEPDRALMASAAPRQTPRAPPQGRDQPPQGAIPPFPKGRLDRLPERP